MNLILWLIGIIGILALAFERPSAPEQYTKHVWFKCSHTKLRKIGNDPTSPLWYVPAV